ncbi:MAG: glycosyltransferase [Lachnospiraceae bacterium]|nr:glycosyltransferase [Lachnospiraceae bacterium]
MQDYAQTPRISVIMGIYNCEGTLGEAIDCILNQTVTDWELILCDDGSRDGTFSIAREYADAHPGKIILLQNETNQGLNYTLNRCLSVARGEYIARMDGDDRCLPQRFALELEVLEQEPDIAIVSSDMEFFDETGVWGRVSHPAYPVKEDFTAGTPFCHAPCMVRKCAYEAVGGYSEARRLLRVEDYHLWVKMYAAGFTGRNIQVPLYQMRDDRNAYSRRKFRYRLNEAWVKAYLVKALGLPKWKVVYALRPIIVGLLPGKVYDWMHKRRLGEKSRKVG